MQQNERVPETSNLPAGSAHVTSERQSQRLLTAFVISGMLFMLLPGTLLGVWNLLNISQKHQPSALPQAWLQAHGLAQIFGWIGSFILGIGLYSLTKTQSSRSFPTRAGWIVWSFWTCGVFLRWIAGVTGWAWRTSLSLSGVLQLAGFILFYLVVRKHRAHPRANPSAVWMRIVIAGTLGFLVTLIVNCWMLFQQAIQGDSPSLPHLSDQRFVVLAVWGVLVPTIWGFNARWLPVFAGLRQPDGRNLSIAYGMRVAGIAATFLGWMPLAAAAFFLATVLAIDALHVWKRAIQPPKLLNVHRSFPWFARFSYAWLLLSCILAALAVSFDHSGGIWGASRHALTVGFVAGMVFTIGQRVLPAFCGMRLLWSARLMFWSLFLLFFGCSLRVFSEPLAYENIWASAWKVLPVSAVTELAAVTLFALNIGATLLQPPAHLRKQSGVSLPKGVA